jgi:hypothetical protein
LIIRDVGTVLLGVGFAMLAGAAVIHDPTALDANIGAGALTLLGIPLGAVGLALVIVGAAHQAWQRARSRNGE